MATHNERLAAVEGAVTGLSGKLDDVIAALRQMAKPAMPNMLPAAAALADVASFHSGMRDGEMRTASRVRDLLHPGAESAGFHDNDVVQLREGEGFERGNAIRASWTKVGVPADTPILGSIMRYIMTTKDGCRKYRVKLAPPRKGLPSPGVDGIPDKELALVAAA